MYQLNYEMENVVLEPIAVTPEVSMLQNMQVSRHHQVQSTLTIWKI